VARRTSEDMSGMPVGGHAATEDRRQITNPTRTPGWMNLCCQRAPSPTHFELTHTSHMLLASNNPHSATSDKKYVRARLMHVAGGSGEQYRLALAGWMWVGRQVGGWVGCSPSCKR
jgi:hypothetical protein